MNKLITYLLVSTTLSALAQLILKTGMTEYGQIEPGIQMILAIFHPIVFTGLATYVISAFFWILALSKAKVSYAYPFASLGYVIVAIISYFTGEAVSLTRWLGIGIIILGVYIVSKSKNK